MVEQFSTVAVPLVLHSRFSASSGGSLLVLAVLFSVLKLLCLGGSPIGGGGCKLQQDLRGRWAAVARSVIKGMEIGPKEKGDEND